MQAIWAISQTILRDHCREEIPYPTFNHCPQCGHFVNLVRHGYYQRHIPEEDRVWVLDICRYLCPDCGRTLSLLPWFLLPFFQHPRSTIFTALREHFRGRVETFISRQLQSFYARRFIRNLNAIVSSFRHKGFYEPLPGDIREKAIRLLGWLEYTSPSASIEMIDESSDHTPANFMALSLYSRGGVSCKS